MSGQAPDTVAVTGATGWLGSRIAERLAHHQVPQLLVTRRPEQVTQLPGAEVRGPAVYDDAPAMREALEGAATLVLVSSHPTGKRLEEHAGAVEAAAAVGVERVVYVSLLGASSPTATYRNARDHWMTEQYLAGCGLRHTVLRAGIYASTVAAIAGEDYVVRGPGADGRAAFVTHEDIAAVAEAVVLDQEGTHDGDILEVTGPQLLTLHEAAAEAAAATGKPYRYEPEGLEEAFARRWAQGISGEQIESWLSWFQAIAQGDVSTLTDVVPRLTGAPATPVGEARAWPERKTAR